MAGHDWSRSNNWKLHQIYQYIFDVIETFSLSYHVNRSKHNYRVRVSVSFLEKGKGGKIEEI